MILLLFRGKGGILPLLFYEYFTRFLIMAKNFIKLLCIVVCVFYTHPNIAQKKDTLTNPLLKKGNVRLSFSTSVAGVLSTEGQFIRAVQYTTNPRISYFVFPKTEIGIQYKNYYAKTFETKTPISINLVGGFVRYSIPVMKSRMSSLILEMNYFEGAYNCKGGLCDSAINTAPNHIRLRTLAPGIGVSFAPVRRWKSRLNFDLYFRRHFFLINQQYRGGVVPLRGDGKFGISYYIFPKK